MAVGSGRRFGVRRTAGLAVGLLGLILATACTTSVQGSPAAAEAPGAPPLTIAPNTPTAPPPNIVEPPADPSARALEAHRLAAATALVSTTFPDRSDTCNPYGAFVDPATLETAYFPPGTAAPILEKYGFVTAWGLCGQTADQRFNTLTLSIELSDPASATAAATELAIAGKQDGDRATTIQGGVPVVVRPQGDQDWVQIWAPVGRMIAYTFHVSPSGQSVDEAVRMIGDQVAALSAFTPTAQADVPNLPPDPTGLAAFALDPPGTVDPITGPFDLDSYLRIAIDPARERELLSANGFTGMYLKQSTDGTLYYGVAIYGFPTSAQTNVVYDGFAALETSSFGGTPFTLASIPQAPCFFADAGTPDQPYFYQRCYVGYGSYLVSVDVAGLSSADDSSIMNDLLPRQRDLIDG
jgi:hypothetical protein